MKNQTKIEMKKNRDYKAKGKRDKKKEYLEPCYWYDNFIIETCMTGNVLYTNNIHFGGKKQNKTKQTTITKSRHLYKPPQCHF